MTTASLAEATGRVLRVDLTNERITQERVDEATLGQLIGGVGLGAKYLYEEVPPGVNWDDPENRLIMAPGPLAGTRMSGSGTFSVVTKGPLTNLAAASQANGFFGAYLRFSGFDAIVIQGAAKDWKYLYIHGGTIELRDAGHLLGKDAWETDDLIKRELGFRGRGASVFSIGPAGENLVKFAGVVGDKGHMAGTNGTGAVMGSKKLKAIVAARGRGEVMVKERRRLSAIAKASFEELVQNDPTGARIYYWGTAGSYEVAEGRPLGGFLPVKNLTTNLFPQARDFSGQFMRERFQVKPQPCWACQMGHCHRVKVTEGPYKDFEGEEPEYEGTAAWGPLIGNTDPGAMIMLNDLNDRLGMDLKEAGFVLSLAIEAYEKGIITKEQTDGLELTWGNVEAVRALLHKIARREGFGNILAEGVMRAAEKIGGEAPNFAVYTKRGIAPHTHDPRSRWWIMFAQGVSNMGSIEAGIGRLDELGIAPPTDDFSPEEIVNYQAKSNGRRMFEDTLGTCMFCNMTTLTNLVDALNATTGSNLSLQQAMEVGQRITNLLRAFNFRHGLTAEEEVPSPRLLSAPVDGPVAGKSIAPAWETMQHDYYELMGWDRHTGKPLPETLRALGLEFAIRDIWEVEPAR